MGIWAGQGLVCPPAAGSYFLIDLEGSAAAKGAEGQAGLQGCGLS